MADQAANTETRKPRNPKARHRGPWLPDPTKERTGEKIGGGYFVFRRGDDTKRIRPNSWPFEHPTEEAAVTEAERLSKEWPGYDFDIVHVIRTVRFDSEETLEAAQ